MKKRKLRMTIYKIIEIDDFPDGYSDGDWTVLEFFDYINEYNEGLNLTAEEKKAISLKYKRKKLTDFSDFMNIYCECCHWKVLNVSARNSYDYSITFYKEVK